MNKKITLNEVVDELKKTFIKANNSEDPVIKNVLLMTKLIVALAAFHIVIALIPHVFKIIVFGICVFVLYWTVKNLN